MMPHLWPLTSSTITTANRFRKSDTGFYLNLKIVFVNDSELHVREYVDEVHRKYAFHWQNQEGELIARWDNAPHFADLGIFPHHKHLTTELVVESHDISFDEVLFSIQYQLQKV